MKREYIYHICLKITEDIPPAAAAVRRSRGDGNETKAAYTA